MARLVFIFFFLRIIILVIWYLKRNGQFLSALHGPPASVTRVSWLNLAARVPEAGIQISPTHRSRYQAAITG